ncbi:Cytochrome P450 monooxygenase aclC [Colletotrichum sidae]|uniref:Cytochrome P450 monooxygenase aclC n=1 Tax=Colletotrichum sidae TaxID=1347389 RepID=A0A4R8T0S4_9PEZI|nr:Cytochrome P450 monooxygenase aclC [Colletotrichum sidae]
MSQLLGRCVGLVSGREWRALRTVTEAPFGHAAVVLQTGRFQSCIEEHFQSLHNQVKSGNIERGLLHPVYDLAMLPFWIVAEMYVINGGIHRFSWARFLPTTGNAKLAEFKENWRRFNQDALAHAQQHSIAAPIISMTEAVSAGAIDEDQLLQTLDESLFANLDVTIGGLSWVPVFLSAHTDVQDRLRTEIASAVANGPESLHRYLADGRTTYLAACVMESSRLRPLAAFSVPQAAPTSRRISVGQGEEYVIPGGTSFVVDAYALNVRNEAWAPDNEDFRPERFMERTDKEARDRRYLFWRFGFGPRQCMGRHAADLIIRMTVAHLVRHYDLGLLPSDDELGEKGWSRNRDSWITHPDFKIRCEKRS